VNSAPTTRWQAAILDQEISPPSLAVKNIFQFLEAATALEHQDWVLERQTVLTLDTDFWVLERHSFTALEFFFNLSSSLIPMVYFEFPLRPENKTNTKNTLKY
jgi:hypothetical protein